MKVGVQRCLTRYPQPVLVLPCTCVGQPHMGPALALSSARSEGGPQAKRRNSREGLGPAGPTPTISLLRTTWKAQPLMQREL
jgi:hypothetical protein